MTKIFLHLKGKQTNWIEEITLEAKQELRRDREYYKNKERGTDLRNFVLEKILKRESWLQRPKNNVLLNLYILIPSRGQMAQHPILLGAVQTYKMTLFDPWNGYGKLTTTECLCYFFFVEYFRSVSILYKIPGSSLCKHWMHSTSSLPTAVSCAQITST